jgi:hypothetical protein
MDANQEEAKAACLAVQLASSGFPPLPPSLKGILLSPSLQLIPLT